MSMDLLAFVTRGQAHSAIPTLRVNMEKTFMLWSLSDLGWEHGASQFYQLRHLNKLLKLSG